MVSKKKEAIKPVVAKPLNDTNKVNKSSTKNVTKMVTKTVTTTKIISIGKNDIIAKFTSDKRVRPSYNLSEYTVEKIKVIFNINSDSMFF